MKRGDWFTVARGELSEVSFHSEYAARQAAEKLVKDGAACVAILEVKAVVQIVPQWDDPQMAVKA